MPNIIFDFINIPLVHTEYQSIIIFNLFGFHAHRSIPEGLFYVFKSNTKRLGHPYQKIAKF